MVPLPKKNETPESEHGPVCLLSWAGHVSGMEAGESNHIHRQTLCPDTQTRRGLQTSAGHWHHTESVAPWVTTAHPARPPATLQLVLPHLSVLSGWGFREHSISKVDFLKSCDGPTALHTAGESPGPTGMSDKSQRWAGAGR